MIGKEAVLGHRSLSQQFLVAVDLLLLFLDLKLLLVELKQLTGIGFCLERAFHLDLKLNGFRLGSFNLGCDVLDLPLLLIR